MNPFTQQTKPIPFPKIPAPRLEGLTVQVPAPKPITENDVIARMVELQRVYATVTPRKKGEKLQPTDEVCITVLGYCGGKLVPRSAQFEVWVRLDEPSTIPDITKAVALAKVGDGLKVQVTLPPEFHLPELRGKPAVYLVDVKEAQSLTMPKADDPAFLAKLGAKTVKEAFAKIADDVVAQRKARASFDALELVIDALASKVDVKIPAPLLKQEVWNQWREVEGKLLADRGLVGQEQTDSFESWQADPVIVADVERRVRNTLIVGALAEAHAAELTPERIAKAATRWVPFLGVPPEKVQEAIAGGTASRTQLTGVLLQLATAELVLEKAKIAWV